MRAFAQRIHDADSSLTLIGSGSPEQAKGFSERTESPFQVLSDPQLHGYQAMELQQKLFGGFRLQTIPRLINAMRDGFRAFGTQGSPHQLGGVFVITTDDDLAYSYISKTLDDRGDPREILTTLERLQTAPPRPSPI